MGGSYVLMTARRACNFVVSQQAGVRALLHGANNHDTEFWAMPINGMRSFPPMRLCVAKLSTKTNKCKDTGEKM
jgi:hypothetical protein